jgi:hypothetical protein
LLTILLWTKFVFSSILTSCGLILIVSLRFLTFSRTKLCFRFDFDKLKAKIVVLLRFRGCESDSKAVRKFIEAARLFVEAVRALVEAVRVIVEG